MKIYTFGRFFFFFFNSQKG